MSLEVLVPNEVPQHVTQAQDANQAALFARGRARFGIRRHVFGFDNDESVAPSFPDVGED